MHVVEPEPHRTFRRGLLIAVVVGALWRLGMLVVDKWRQPLLLNDSLYYSAQAQQLVDGRWFREIFVDQPGAEHGPLTSVLMATVSWVGDPLPWQRLVTVACGIAAIVVIAMLARRIGGPRVGVVAAAVAAVYPNLWMNDGLVMSESVSVLAVASVLLAAHRSPAAPSVRRAVVVGVLAGLAALARSELVLLVPGLVVLHGTAGAAPPRWRWSTPSTVAATAALVMLPWVAFNLIRFEHPVTLTTNDGTTLLGSNCDSTYSGSNVGGWSLLCVVDDPDYAADEEPSVRSRRQRSLAISYVRDHLHEVPEVVAARIGRTLDLYGIESLVDQDVGEERYRWASWAGIVTWWLLAVAALAGVRHIRGSDRWLLLLPCVVVAITTVLFYGGHRIRSSMEPSVIVAASVAAVHLVDRRSGRRTSDRSEPSGERA